MFFMACTIIVQKQKQLCLRAANAEDFAELLERWCSYFGIENYIAYGTIDFETGDPNSSVGTALTRSKSYWNIIKLGSKYYVADAVNCKKITESGVKVLSDIDTITETKKTGNYIDKKAYTIKSVIQYKGLILIAFNLETVSVPYYSH